MNTEIVSSESEITSHRLRTVNNSQRLHHNHEETCVPIHHDGKPRILYIVTRAERGGAQTHVLSLASTMRPEFDVAVATGEEGFLTETCREQGIAVYVLPHLQRQVSPPADARAFWEIRQLLRRLQPDLIHAHTSKAGFLGRLAGHTLGIPTIYTVHSWLFGTAVLSRVWGLLGAPCERLASNWCERLIAVSEEGARVALKHRIAPPAKVVTIHNGIPDCPERANLSSNRPPVITMVARFTVGKDQEVLLRAFATMQAGPRLRLVGDGPLRQSCEKLAHELGICERVEFLGNRDDVASLLAASDVFVLASKCEMLPISVLEAMRAGLPAVVSEVGGVGEAVAHGKTGLLAPCGSAPALAQALTQLIEDRDLRLRLGRAARQRFEERFLYVQQEKRTRSVYREVLFESGRTVSGVPRLAQTA